MRALLFHNPSAGDGRLTADELIATLQGAGLSLTYGSTEAPEFPAMLGHPADLVIAAGGDGTVAKVLTRMPNRAIPVAILPLGSANNIGRTLGISGTVAELAAAWPDAATRRLDIGMASGPWGREPFVEAVGLGALAKGIGRCEGVETQGEDSIRCGRLEFRKALAKAKPLEARLEIDGVEQEGDLLLIEILNIGHAGPALPLAPAADPGDGLLDVVVVDVGRRAAILDWLEAPEGPPPFDVRRGRKITLTAEKAVVRLDDSFHRLPKGPTEIVVTLESVGVNILVPPAATRQHRLFESVTAGPTS